MATNSPKKRGQPLRYGEKLVARSLRLPPALWAALDRAAFEASKPGAIVTTSEIVRRKLSLP